MKKLKTQRDIFFDALYAQAKEDKDLIFISADQGAPSLDKFRSDLPSQYINVGIAEQQAITLAAGMSYEGKKTYVHAIANFITLRCYEQIRLNICAMNIPVTIVGVGAGLSYDDSGPTHHTVEDITILRALPRLKIHNITDGVMAKYFAEASPNADYPMYIRLDRKTSEDIYTESDDFTIGFKSFQESNDLCIVATGNMVYRAFEVADELKKNGINAGVVDVYTIPTSEKELAKNLSQYKRVVTLEEHELKGGFGSYILEVLADNNIQMPVKRMGLNFNEGYCYKYGGREHMQSLYGLDVNSIVGTILEL